MAVLSASVRHFHLHVHPAFCMTRPRRWKTARTLHDHAINWRLRCGCPTCMSVGTNMRHVRQTSCPGCSTCPACRRNPRRRPPFRSHAARPCQPRPRPPRRARALCSARPRRCSPWCRRRRAAVWPLQLWDGVHRRFECGDARGGGTLDRERAPLPRPRPPRSGRSRSARPALPGRLYVCVRGFDPGLQSQQLHLQNGYRRVLVGKDAVTVGHGSSDTLVVTLVARVT